MMIATLYFALVLLASIVSLGLVALAWTRRHTTAGLPFFLMTVAIGFVVWVNLGILLTDNRDTAYVLVRLQNLGVGMSAINILIFSIIYTNRVQHLRRRTLIFFYLLILGNFAVAWTDPIHGLFFREFNIFQVSNFTFTQSVNNVWNVISGLFYSGIGLVGTGFLANRIYTTQGKIQRQLISVFFAAVIPILMYIIFISMQIISPETIGLFRPVPISFSLTAIIITYTMYRDQLLDLAPIAQSLILSEIPEAIIITDEQDRIVSLNPAIYEVWDIQAKDVIGQPVLSVFPELSEFDKSPHISVLPHNRPHEIQFERTTRPLMRDGKQIGTITILYDVTHRLFIENALRDSEVRYRSVVNTMSEGVVLQTIEGMIQACNPSAERILGLTVDQMMRRSSVDPRWRAVHDDGSPFPGETHPAMVTLQTGEPQSNVIMGVYKPDDSLTWITVSSEPLIHFGEDKPYAVVTTFVDITQSRAFQNALEQSEKKFALAFRNSPVPIVISTTDTTDPTYVEANKAYLELVGYTWDELDGHSMDMDTDTLADSKVNADDNGEDYDLREIQVRHRNGEMRDVLLAVQPITIDNLAYNLQIMLDITERKRAQQREFEFQLEKERTQLLTGFIQDAAHEFRTPLTIIGTDGYLISRLEDADKRATKSERINVQVNRITHLVDMLLKMTKLQTQQLDLVPIDLAHFVNQIYQSHSMNHPTQTVKLDLIEPLPTIEADSNLLDEAIKHLLDNASRFSSSDATIHMGATQTSEHVTISIRDNGMGISADNLPHIFDTFWRDDEAHSTPGLGLGLPIAKEIIEKHGGEIKVDSEPDKGSDFCIILPLNHQN